MMIDRLSKKFKYTKHTIIRDMVRLDTKLGGISIEPVRSAVYRNKNALNERRSAKNINILDFICS